MTTQPESGTPAETSEASDDVFRVMWGTVTNPEGVSFPALLGPCSKAGVRTFYVEPQDAPEGEEPGRRCEFFREVHPGSLVRGVYKFESGIRSGETIERPVCVWERNTGQKCTLDHGEPPAAPSHPEGETVGVEALAWVIHRTCGCGTTVGLDGKPGPVCEPDDEDYAIARALLASGLVVTEEAARAREAAAVKTCVAIHDGIRARAVRESASHALREAADDIDNHGYLLRWADTNADHTTAEYLRWRADTIDGSASHAE